jgi:magnesium-transporting ATPase (P-type)
MKRKNKTVLTLEDFRNRVVTSFIGLVIAFLAYISGESILNFGNPLLALQPNLFNAVGFLTLFLFIMFLFFIGILLIIYPWSKDFGK